MTFSFHPAPRKDTMAFWSTFKCISSLVLLTAASNTVFANDSGPKILDLSKPFSAGNVYNTDAAEIETYLEWDTRRFLVIDDGTIGMDYQRDAVDDETVFELLSATKPVMSFIIGTIISSQEQDFSMDDTLGDISEENDWSTIDDPAEVEFKKNVAIYEMLTMTSGLTHQWHPSHTVSPNPLQPFDLLLHKVITTCCSSAIQLL